MLIRVGKRGPFTIYCEYIENLNKIADDNKWLKCFLQSFSG